ncbi:hypothetical protein ACETRX_35140 [Labrys portucalensis]|uniref:Uncharacterized protein n=1 Tax=Labrys neptuniae TaxID=376174 RepID=A0ABV6ZRT3_9HYPH
MELREIWIAYCEQQLGDRAASAAPVIISPKKAMALLWNFNALFTPRVAAITATAFSTQFDEEADGALAMLARTDSFASWERMSAGAWRVLYERHLYTLVVMDANAALSEPVISRLPSGLTRQSQARALLLQFLLGGARSIDRQLLPLSKPGTLPAFPANTSLRRH